MIFYVGILFFSRAVFAQPQYERIYDGFLEGSLTLLYSGGATITQPRAADIDNDGDMDVLIGDSEYRLWLYRNDGTRSQPRFTLVTDRFQGFGVIPPTNRRLKTDLGDLDNDGDLDMVEGNLNLHNVNIWNNTGTANEMILTPSQSSVLPSGIGDNSCPTLCDIDDDGDLDLFVSDNSTLWFYPNDGTPESPSFGTRVSVLSGGLTTRCVSFGDLDNDSDQDMLVGHYDGNISYYRNIGSSTSPSWLLIDSDYFEDTSDRKISWRTVDLCDLDGDHDLDALVGSSQGFFEVWENIGCSAEANFRYKPGIVDAFEGSPTLFAFADIDSDGDLDLFFGEQKTGDTEDIVFYRNMGSPMFPSWHRETSNLTGVNIGTHPRIKLADIDGDNDLDLFTSGIGGVSGNLLYFENVGTSHQYSYPSYSNIPGTSIANTCCPEFVDIDNDGILELFVGTSGGSIRFYENTGTVTSPNFVLSDSSYAGISLTSLYASISITFYDSDGDEDYDLFCGDYTGAAVHKIRYFENTGTKYSAAFNSTPTDSNFGPIDLYWETAIGFYDLDGDSDEEMLLCDENGGIYFFKNIADHLTVSPASITVISSDSVLFSVSASIGSITWSLHTNRSGAPVLTPSGTTCTYIAGATTGVVDVVEVVDASGTIGRAHVNVISATEMGLVGKAIIISGWKGTGDPLWPDTDRSATNYLANFAYRTLLHRGFSKENIYYLSPDPDQDVDGNGSNDDIDGESNLTNAQYAFNTWAGESPAPTKLLVYLDDHGGNQGIDQGYLRLNPGEVLLAQSVDAWLDALQTDHPSLQVTLAVDCCHSGSFLDECAPPTGKERIVLTSAKASEDAHFAAGGAISFSEAFFNSVYTGLSVGKSFDNASGAMDRYQTAWLDDSGDGVWDKDVDGTLASGEVIGATFIAGADRPQIGKINANQTITSGTSAMLWASEISSVYPLEEVFAVIVPPSFLPNPNQNPEQPITELPQLELTWNSGQSRYEGTYTDFTETGAYKVVIYARDIWDSYSYPKQTYVNQLGSTEKVIIVTGDTDYNPYSSWYYSNALSNYAYQTCRDRWIAKDRIRYLNGETGQDVDGNGAADDVYGLPTLSNLEDAITVWAGDALKVTIYLVGQMTPDSFDVNSSEFLAAYQLDTWLDTLQSSSPDKIVIVLEGDDSGSFIDDLTGTGRIIVTSCASPGSSLNQVYGLLSFSQFFWNQVLMGINVRDSYQFSRQAMRYLTSYQQQAKLEDGAGGSEAVGTWIGAAFVTGEEVPTIGEIPENLFIDSGLDVTLWASQVSDPDGIARVWALIMPPDYDPSEDVIDEVTMTYQSANTRYEYDYAGLTEIGKYTLTFFAKDRVGEISQPKQTYLLYGMDEYEPDDASPEATITIIPPVPEYQYHNFHDAGDTDWLRAYFFAGRDYWIETRNLEANCDLVLRLYNSSGPLVPPVTADDHIGNTPEDIYYHSSATDEYFIEVYHANSSIFGASTGYEIRISDTSPGNNGLATAIGEGQRSMKCEWDSVSGARGYNLYRSTHPDGPYVTKANDDGEIPEDGSDRSSILMNALIP